MLNYLISTIIVLPIIFAASFIFKKNNSNKTSILLNTFLGLQLLLIAISAYLASKEDTNVVWSILKENESTFGLSIMLRIDSIRAYFLLYVQLGILIFYLYLQEKVHESYILASALLSLSNIFLVGSDNVFSFLIGFAFTIFASFYALSSGEAQAEKKAEAYVSWIVVKLIGMTLIVLSLASVYSDSPNLNFQEINSAAAQLKFIPFVFLILGTLTLSLSYPFLSSFRAGVFIGKQSILVFIFSTTLSVAMLCYKLHPTFLAMPNIEAAEGLIVLTMFVLGLSIMTETNPTVVALITAIFFTMFIVLSSLIVKSNIGIVLGLPAVVGMPALLNASRTESSNKPLMLFLSLPILFLPLFPSGLGILELFSSYYEKINSSDAQSVYPIIAFLVVLNGALIMFMIGVFGFIKNNWNLKQKTNSNTMQTISIMTAAFLSLSIFSGTPLFSGFILKQDLVWLSQFQWLAKSSDLNSEFNSFNQNAVINYFSVLFFSALMAFFVFYSNDERAASTRKKLGTTLNKLSLPATGELNFDLNIWKYIFKPAVEIFARLSNVVNNVIINQAFEFLNKTYNFIRVRVGVLDDSVLDNKIIECFGQLLLSCSKAVRFIHTGQVQYYIGFGILIMVGIIYRLIFLVMK